MKTIKLGTFLGIPLYIHWSFGLIILYVLFVSFREGMDVYQSLAFSLYVMAIFFCVVLHEYGHALMARYYKIRTMDIIILPIGGVARLQGLPNSPGGELMVAIAGPLVNLVIALVIIAGMYFSGHGIIYPDTDGLSILTNPIGFLHLVLVLNLVLFFFNLIPAYPMDGGRILRALLSYKLTKLQATRIASLVGRVFAVAFIALALYNRLPSLLFIGFFIFYMAGKEYNNLKNQP